MQESNRITARDCLRRAPLRSGSSATPAQMQAGFGRNDARRNAQRNIQQLFPALRAPSPSERAGGEAGRRAAVGMTRYATLNATLNNARRACRCPPPAGVSEGRGWIPLCLCASIPLCPRSYSPNSSKIRINSYIQIRIN
jgi:hypothetical protein